MKGLHQISKVENTKVTDVFEPKEAYAEEKLAVVEVDRTVVGLHVVLSLEALDTAALGYQAPLPEEEVTETGSELKRVLQNPRSGKKEQKVSFLLNIPQKSCDCIVQTVATLRLSK